MPDAERVDVRDVERATSIICNWHASKLFGLWKPPPEPPARHSGLQVWDEGETTFLTNSGAMLILSVEVPSFQTIVSRDIKLANTNALIFSFSYALFQFK